MFRVLKRGLRRVQSESMMNFLYLLKPSQRTKFTQTAREYDIDMQNVPDTNNGQRTLGSTGEGHTYLSIHKGSIHMIHTEIHITKDWKKNKWINEGLTQKRHLPANPQQFLPSPPRDPGNIRNKDLLQEQYIEYRTLRMHLLRNLESIWLSLLERADEIASS